MQTIFVGFCTENFPQQLNTSLDFSNMAKSLACSFQSRQSKIMAYLKDFYPFHIDDSDTEYVISEMKYDDSDILLLDADSIAKRGRCFAFDKLSFAIWRNHLP